MLRIVVLLSLSVALGACTQTASAPAPAAPAAPGSASLVTPSNFRLPEGQGCSGDISRFRAVQENDLQTGHVNRQVYDRIRGEIDQAASLCSSGNDAGARAALSATKRRYGYPA